MQEKESRQGAPVMGMCWCVSVWAGWNCKEKERLHRQT